MIHIVGLRGTERGESAEFFERGELLFDGVGDVVLREQLADRSLLALGGRSVVAPDVEDERVVTQVAIFESLHQAPDLHVGVLDETGEELHAAALEGALVFRDVGPGGHRLIARGEHGTGWDDAHFELALVHALAVGVPAVIELAFVFVRPFRPDVMRTVGRAGCPIHQERLVRGDAGIPNLPTFSLGLPALAPRHVGIRCNSSDELRRLILGLHPHPIVDRETGVSPRQ